MSGVAIKAMSDTYSAITGDDKYEDAWREPISTVFGGDKDTPEAKVPGTDPALDDAARLEREEEIRRQLRLQGRGRASTVLTSGMDRMGGSSTRRTLFGE